MKYERLFAAGKIGSLDIANRTVITAMETVMAEFNGDPSDLTISYYLERARGEVGLIITGIARVNNFSGVTSPRQLSMASDANIPEMRKLTDKIHETDTKIFCQLHHPGRQTYSAMMYVWPLMSWVAGRVKCFIRVFGPLVSFYNKLLAVTYSPAVKAPSDVLCQHVKQKAKPFSNRQVKKVISQFVDAAERCQESGFDGVEIHGAHGYLVQQFLSTRTNRRTDEYGGSFENRFRFLKEILCGIKAKCGDDFPVSVRLSVDEFYDDCDTEDRGITLGEGVRFAGAAEACGADAINVSSGTYETLNTWLEPVTYKPGWRKYLAAEVRKNVAIPVIAANLIRSPQQADEQIAEGSQDFAGLGRPLLSDPYWVRKARENREDEIVTCINCLHCFETVNRNAWLGKPLECARNPLLGRENDYDRTPRDAEGKTAVVVGAGVAGMTAAAVFAKRGFRTIVFESSERPGGQVKLAQLAPLKLRIGVCIDELERQAKRAGVEFRYGTEATFADIKRLNPQTIICATGSLPFEPPISGKDADYVYSVERVLGGVAELKDKNVVVVGSGLTGLETAAYLADAGNRVVVVEMQDSIGPSAYHQHLDDVFEKLKKHDVRFETSVRLVQIERGSVALENVKTGWRTQLNSDAVVLAIGNRSNRILFDELTEQHSDVRLVGDAIIPGKIADAIRTGFEAALAVRVSGSFI